MSIYEHECQECGLEFDKLVLSRPAEERVACPACESQQLRKLVSLVTSNRASHLASTQAAAGCDNGT